MPENFTLTRDDSHPKPRKQRKKQQAASLPRPERVCACGCGEKFIPIRADQIYKGFTHRIANRVSHECPTCGARHQVKSPEKQARETDRPKRGQP